MSNTNLSTLADGHAAFTTAEEIGADAATDAPATSPICFGIGVAVGTTIAKGC